MHPPCFNSQDQYEDWQEWKRRSREDVTICDDCTKGYQEQMKAEGLCFTVKRVTIYRIATKKPT